MDAAEYKHVVLGLIFLKYISDSFEEMHQRLLAAKDEGADPEAADESRRKRLLGAEGGPVGASPGQGQAAYPGVTRRVPSPARRINLLASTMSRIDYQLGDRGRNPVRLGDRHYLPKSACNRAKAYRILHLANITYSAA